HFAGIVFVEEIAGHRTELLLHFGSRILVEHDRSPVLVGEAARPAHDHAGPVGIWTDHHLSQEQPGHGLVPIRVTFRPVGVPVPTWVMSIEISASSGSAVVVRTAGVAAPTVVRDALSKEGFVEKIVPVPARRTSTVKTLPAVCALVRLPRTLVSVMA